MALGNAWQTNRATKTYNEVMPMSDWINDSPKQQTTARCDGRKGELECVLTIR